MNAVQQAIVDGRRRRRPDLRSIEGDIIRGISGDISHDEDAHALGLLLKAIRSLPGREQDAVFAYLLDRALVPARAAVSRVPDPTARIPWSIPAGFRGTRLELGSTAPWARWGASLMLRRLGDGVTIGQLAAELGVEPQLLQVALRDLAARPHISDRLAGILGQLAEGHTITQAARTLGITKKDTTAELEASDELAGALCSSLMARAALPGPPAGYLATTAQGPWRTLPARFPVQQYGRLKDWCEENNFPMAVVVRGVVERFLDEQQRRAD